MKKANIFITISIVFITSLILFYGIRLVHFYRLVHTAEKLGETQFNSVIKNRSYDKSIISEGDNLYYNGKVLNNYVYYSNRYFRIMALENNNLILVDDDISTILPYNKEEIFSWLNKGKEHEGIYYNSLYKPEEFLTNTKTCLNEDCSEYNDSLIGIISSKQLKKATNHNNFINNNKFYWLADGTYVDNKANILENNDGLYGIRAVITLKSDVLYYGGSGTYFDPYFIDLEDAYEFANTKADTIKPGSYISYSDKIWRVIDNKDNIKVVLNDNIGEFAFSTKSNKYNLSDKSSIAYYLNNTFLNTLNKKCLVKGNFYIGEFKSSYLDKYNESINAYVGMIEIGDLFINDINNYLTITNTGNKNTIYKVISGKLYADTYTNKSSIRPVIYLSKDIKIINGHGTIDSPFEVDKL